jgi:hypothetical protein
MRESRVAAHGTRRQRERAPLPLFAVVDGDKIPPRCFGDPVCAVAVDRRRLRAYEALCESLCRNGQVGITTVEVGGAPRVAALLPIGGVLAVSLLRPEYTEALADGLRARSVRRASARSARTERPAQERRAA